jgi:hypothetical protein
LPTTCNISDDTKDFSIILRIQLLEPEIELSSNLNNTGTPPHVRSV